MRIEAHFRDPAINISLSENFHEIASLVESFQKHGIALDVPGVDKRLWRAAGHPLLYPGSQHVSADNIASAIRSLSRETSDSPLLSTLSGARLKALFVGHVRFPGKQAKQSECTQSLMEIEREALRRFAAYYVTLRAHTRETLTQNMSKRSLP